AKINIAGVRSITKPTKNNKTLVNKRIPIVESVIVVSISARVKGTLAIVKSQAVTIAISFRTGREARWFTSLVEKLLEPLIRIGKGANIKNC
ncbi:MAG: hypothetical protein R6T90_02425, partial [Dissulfuribacterales bacterium]